MGFIVPFVLLDDFIRECVIHRSHFPELIVVFLQSNLSSDSGATLIDPGCLDVTVTFKSTLRLHNQLQKRLVVEEGFEPPTKRLSTACSTSELLHTMDPFLSWPLEGSGCFGCQDPAREP